MASSQSFERHFLVFDEDSSYESIFERATVLVSVGLGSKISYEGPNHYFEFLIICNHNQAFKLNLKVK